MKKILIIAMSAALMSSCSLFRKYERPQSITTENLYGDAESGEDGLASLSWRELFTDPILQDLIQHTLDNNVDLQKAQLNIQEMEEGFKCAKIAYIPSLAFAPSGTLSGGRMWNDGSSNTFGLNKIYSLPISASWQIGQPGYLLNNKRKAEMQLERVRYVKQATQTALVAGVANLYYTLAMLDEQMEIAKKTRVNWEKMLEKQQKLFDAGQYNAAGLASTEANICSIDANIIDLEHSIHELQNTLSTMSGDTPHTITRAALSSWQTPKTVETGVPALLLSRRPDVRIAEYGVAAQFYEVNVARSQFYPGLTLTGSMSWSNQMGQSILNPGALIGSGVASLAQPIFQNGRIRANYRVQKMELEKATLDFQQCLVAAGNEVNTALAKVKTADAKRDIIARQTKAMQKALDATEKLMENSSQYNYLNVLTAQTSLLQCQMGEISNQMEVIQSTIELYQALGGGAE